MLYAPYCFWFWDEPLYDSVYPAKSKEMAKEMLAKGINPGYAHPRISMADLLSQTPGLKDKMKPSPSLPKDEWLSEKWFKAYEGALEEAESANGYIGYVDEYMWPVGRAAGRVIEAHPELASSNLQWEIRNIPGGTDVSLPPSFVTVAASIVSTPGPDDYTVTHESENFKMPWPGVDADPYGLASIGQTVLVDREKLVRVAIQLMCKRDYSDAAFCLEARIGGPGGEIAGRRMLKGGARSYYTISLNIDKVIPAGTLLYVAMIPSEGFPENEVKWSSCIENMDPGGCAYVNGKPSTGDRFLKLSYLTKPSDQGEDVQSFQKSVIRSESLSIIGEGEGFGWTSPENGDWRIYSFKKIDGGDVNVLDKRLARAFIELSHQPYADRFGERMGKSISGVFCDTEGGYGNGNGLAWSNDLPEKYRSNTGRDIRLWLPLMLDDDSEGLSARARFDWFEAVSDLYSSFYAEINDWLAVHNMYYIVNVWEESLQWQASFVSDHMKVQRSFSMPGTDCLGLKAYDIHDFKETQSVSAFEGRRLQSEIMGAGGWSTFSPVSVKECTNAVLAWGVNHIVPHGIFMTRALEGNVWVPDWYSRNPMWPNMNLWSDFVRRASYINSQGRVDPDVLLYNPMSSVWALLGKTDMLWWSPIAGHIGYTDELYSDKAQEINRVYSDAMRLLSKHRLEYLITDRHYVNQMSVKGGKLRYKDFSFKTVVLPPMVVMPLSVAEKLLEFAKAGGMVYSLGALPDGSTENGFYDPQMKKMMEELTGLPSFRRCGEQGLEGDLIAKAEGLTSKIQFISGEFPMLQLHRKVDGRDFFWLVNNNNTKQDCQLSITGIKGSVSIWDCETGKIMPISCEPKGDNTGISLTFEPHEAYWLVIDPDGKPGEAIDRPEFDKILLNVEGEWNITIDETVQPEIEHKVEIPEILTGAGINRTLTLWDQWKELPGIFSGHIDYTKTIELPEFDGELQLDLGSVYHCAEVWINGRRAGAKLWPPHKLTTDLFKSGKNEIVIRVGNLVNINYGMSSPSGLLGPVTIMKIE